MEINLLALATPIVRQVAPVITEKIKSKVSPSEIQQAIEAGIKAAEMEDEKLSLEQHLFYKSKPDSVTGVPGFLAKYLNCAGVQNELAKSFNNEGKPDGSGKSTLVSYFTVMLTQGNAKDLGLDGNTDWLPIVIEIRDFEQNLNLNIFDYLRQFAESNLTTKKLPPDFFKHK